MSILTVALRRKAIVEVINIGRKKDVKAITNASVSDFAVKPKLVCTPVRKAKTKKPTK